MSLEELLKEILFKLNKIEIDHRLLLLKLQEKKLDHMIQKSIICSLNMSDVLTIDEIMNYLNGRLEIPIEKDYCYRKILELGYLWTQESFHSDSIHLVGYVINGEYN